MAKSCKDGRSLSPRVSYRKLDIEDGDRFDGRGVYYGATQLEAAMCSDEVVAIVGGGNSAGQAAVFLSSFAKHVFLLVRGPNLSSTMSKYLVSRIEASRKISLQTNTSVQTLDGEAHLQKICWQESVTGRISCDEIQHLFMMTGVDPNTDWLADCLALDGQRFIKTGADVMDSWRLKHLSRFLPSRRICLSLCGRRCAIRQHQTSRFGRRRGFDGDPVCSPDSCDSVADFRLVIRRLPTNVPRRSLE